MYTQRYSLIIAGLQLFIPLIVLFDWLFNLGIIHIQLGLYLKSLVTLIFLYVFISHRFRDFIFNNVLIYLSLLYILYSIFSDNIQGNLYITARILYWVLGAFAFYYFFKHDLISEKQLIRMLVTTSVIAGVFTFVLMSRSEEHQNASAYLLLWCLPLLLHLNKSKLISVVIAFSMAAIVITIKRGALVALIVSLVIYLVARLRISERNISKLKVFRNGLLFLALVGIILYMRWDLITERFSDRGGSGRDKLYTLIINNYIAGDMLNVSFGNGINSVQKMTSLQSNDPNSVGVAAHSDWLQHLHDFGILGILLMVSLHVSFIKLIVFHAKFRTNTLPFLSMTYTIFLLSTVYSFILTTPDAIILGINLALISFETNQYSPNAGNS